MTGKDFLPLAVQLAAGSSEAEWRTAVSRAYYAAFHVARELLETLRFDVPRGDRAHGYLWLRLQNCGDQEIEKAGSDLNSLRRYRNEADYDLHRPYPQIVTSTPIPMARQTIQTLQSITSPIRNQITTVMKIYERDVLKDVTWHP